MDWTIIDYYIFALFIITLLYGIWRYFTERNSSIVKTIVEPAAVAGVATVATPMVANLLSPHIDKAVNSFDNKVTNAIKSTNVDVESHLQCYKDGSPASYCAVQCKDDPNCKSVSVIYPGGPWGANTSGCCYNADVPLKIANNVDLFVLSHN